MSVEFERGIWLNPARTGRFGTMHHGLLLRRHDFRPVRTASSKARSRQLLLKRGVDIALAGLALLALAPLFLLIAALIKLSMPGPVLFRQQREGLGGKTFVILKFRSMRVATGLAAPDDHLRIPALGRLLRRTSLDELPQLFNVLAGNMSLVGPRPHIVEMPVLDSSYDRLVPYYPLRFDMRPGMTGWAQANGLRGPISEATLAFERIDHDLAYIQNFSLALDLRIIWLTLRNEFLTGTGR